MRECSFFAGKKVEEVQILEPQSPALYSSFFEQLKTITICRGGLWAPKRCAS